MTALSSFDSYTADFRDVDYPLHNLRPHHIIFVWPLNWKYNQSVKNGKCSHPTCTVNLICTLLSDAFEFHSSACLHLFRHIFRFTKGSAPTTCRIFCITIFQLFIHSIFYVEYNQFWGELLVVIARQRLSSTQRREAPSWLNSNAGGR